MKYNMITKQFFIYLILIGCIFSCSNKNESSSKNIKLVQNQIDSLAIHDSLNSIPAFHIQVASFQNKENAENLKAVLYKSDLAAYIATGFNTSNKKVFRIRIGPLSTEEEADTILSQVKNLGYSEAFVVINSQKPELIDSLVTKEENPDLLIIEKKQLTFVEGCSVPQWSPNGREIAFYKKSKNTSGIYAVGTGGGYISKIIESTENRKITPKFSWSPSGDKILFVVKEVNRSWDLVENLYLINKDGSGLKNILSQEKFSFKIFDLKWSPDGQKIAFNAKYGSQQSEYDVIQRVLIISLEKMTSNSNKLYGEENSNYISDPSQLDKTNWALGWQSNNDFLFLSSYDKVLHYEDLAYEIWSFDLSTQIIKKIVSGPIIKEFREIEFIPGHNKIVYSNDTKILSLNLDTGLDSRFFDIQLNDKSTNLFFISHLNKIFMLIGNELWSYDFKGKPLLLDRDLSIQKFTISPEGTKICYGENGYLYKLNLSQAIKKPGNAPGL